MVSAAQALVRSLAAGVQAAIAYGFAALNAILRIVAQPLMALGKALGQNQPAGDSAQGRRAGEFGEEGGDQVLAAAEAGQHDEQQRHAERAASADLGEARSSD